MLSMTMAFAEDGTQNATMFRAYNMEVNWQTCRLPQSYNGSGRSCRDVHKTFCAEMMNAAVA